MIHKDTLHYLSQLTINNNRDWFNENKEQYDSIRKHNEKFVSTLIHELAGFDKGLAHLEAKDCVFRIYRDTRFSKDKTPYKTNMGAYMSKGGRKSVHAGYYLHIQPGESFLAGGLYVPEPNVLKAVRTEMIAMPEVFESILAEPRFKQLFGNLEGESLKNVPTGFPRDFAHPEWLKLKSYNTIHYVSDEKIISDSFLEYAIDVFKAMYPFNQFFNQIIDDLI